MHTNLEKQVGHHQPAQDIQAVVMAAPNEDHLSIAESFLLVSALATLLSSIAVFTLS